MTTNKVRCNKEHGMWVVRAPSELVKLTGMPKKREYRSYQQAKFYRNALVTQLVLLARVRRGRL